MIFHFTSAGSGREMNANKELSCAYPRIVELGRFGVVRYVRVSSMKIDAGPWMKEKYVVFSGTAYGSGGMGGFTLTWYRLKGSAASG